MVKKHIHHFSRGMLIGFEALGLAALTVFLGWLFLIIRLSEGPLNVDFLTNTIERALNNQQTDFEFSVNRALLTWGGGSQPFEFEVSDVQIERKDKTPVFAVKKISIQLAKKYLVFGRFVPSAIKIYGPALKVVRGEDGHFNLNVSQQAEIQAPDITTPGITAPETAGGQTDFLKGLLHQMDDTAKLGFFGGLDKVSITDAVLLYEDKILNVAWRSTKSDVIFTRRRGGLMVDSMANLELDPAHTAYIRGNFYYSWQTHRPNGVIYFSDFNPALVAQQSEQFKFFSGINLPVKGSIAIEMDQDFHPGFGRFMLGTGPGSLSIPGFYPEPIAVQKFFSQGRFNVATREALVEMRLELEGPKLEAKALIRKGEGAHIIQAKALLENMPIDQLKTHWPESLAPDPRAWVTGHLSEGIATKATLNLAMLAPEGDFERLQLQKVGGEIDFNGIKVDYFPPLMPATKAAGKATYDQKSFNLDIKSGVLGDMLVTGSKIAITDLDIQNETIHSKIDIDVSLKGPLRTALKVLDSKPLEYPQALGIKTAEVEGDSSVDVNFKFPLHTKLVKEEVRVAAKAGLDNILLKDMVAGLPLSGGPMTLEVSNGSMTVKGKGRLDTMPVEFSWIKNFDDKAEVASKVEAKLPLEGAALPKFGVPEDMKVTGVIPADVTYTVTHSKMETLLFKGDIALAGFSVPVANYEKTINEPGSLDFILHLKDGKPTSLSSLNFATERAKVKGGLDFADEGAAIFKKASFEQVKMGDTDISLDLETRGLDGYLVKVTGQQLDASSLLKNDDKPNSDEQAAKPVTPLTVSLGVSRILTGKEKHIEQVKLYMRRNMWNRIDQLEVDGTSGGKPVNLRYLQGPKGYTLRLEADNAGAALSALGITGGVRGGRIIVEGRPDPNGGRRGLKGTITLTDFTLVNVPVLGRLLNAMSLAGIVELLNGKGIAFKKMRSDFWWADRGQPESSKNVRLIKIKNGQTSGASLGLTFEGDIDNWSNMLDISGTIIPVSDLNKLVSVIPLVGDILTGGGGGVFAATYTIKGPKADPAVAVNPLSVLAPGILRKLFFEK